MTTVVAALIALLWLFALGFFIGLGWRKSQTF